MVPKISLLGKIKLLSRFSLSFSQLRGKLEERPLAKWSHKWTHVSNLCWLATRFGQELPVLAMTCVVSSLGDYGELHARAQKSPTARRHVASTAFPSRRVSLKFRARAYFARPTTSIAKISYYSQSALMKLKFALKLVQQFSPFGHPTQVHKAALKWTFCDLHCVRKKAFPNLRWLASPFGQGILM